MQNKGFVKVFAVLLTLVCMFYLSFSFVTRHYNSKAAEYAGGDPVKESSYLDSLSTQKVWLGYTLKECREMEISLGLDLKGGMNVVLELNVADVIRSLSNNNQDENFNKALDLAYENQATSQKDFIDLFAEEYKKLDNGARLSAIFSTFELKDKITPQSSAEAIRSQAWPAQKQPLHGRPPHPLPLSQSCKTYQYPVHHPPSGCRKDTPHSAPHTALPYPPHPLWYTP